MGLKIITENYPITVWANEKQTSNGGKFITYSITIDSKDKDGNKVKGYWNCAFKKGVELTNGTKINIKNSFPTVREFTDRNGTVQKQFGIFVMDFDVAEAGEAPKTDSFVDVDLDGIQDLPFN